MPAVRIRHRPDCLRCLSGQGHDRQGDNHQQSGYWYSLLQWIWAYNNDFRWGLYALESGQKLAEGRTTASWLPDSRMLVAECDDPSSKAGQWQVSIRSIDGQVQPLLSNLSGCGEVVASPDLSYHALVYHDATTIMIVDRNGTIQATLSGTLEGTSLTRHSSLGGIRSTSSSWFYVPGG